jgi:hypothetical protein
MAEKERKNNIQIVKELFLLKTSFIVPSPCVFKLHLSYLNDVSSAISFLKIGSTCRV